MEKPRQKQELGCCKQDKMSKALEKAKSQQGQKVE